MLLASATECIGDVLVRACREFWPNRECLFQDAHEHVTHPLSDSWVWTVGVARNEFSIYRDEAAAASWEAKGAVKSNANMMIHFIIGDPLLDDPRVAEVAVIFDKWTPEIRRLLRDLKTSLVSTPSQAPTAEAA